MTTSCIYREKIVLGGEQKKGGWQALRSTLEWLSFFVNLFAKLDHMRNLPIQFKLASVRYVSVSIK